MCLFWDLEASSSALYQQMAEHEPNPMRAAAWRKLQDRRLILGNGRENHNVYLSQKLLWSCQEMIRLTERDSLSDADPLRVMADDYAVEVLTGHAHHVAATADFGLVDDRYREVQHQRRLRH